MFVSDNRVISVMPCVDLCFPTKIVHFCRKPEVRVNHLKVPGLIFSDTSVFVYVLNRFKRRKLRKKFQFQS